MTVPVFGAAPTVVGSFPDAAPDPLVGDIVSRFSRMPAWPQLPVRAWRESMYVQYSEQLPGAVIDEAAQRIWFERGAGFDEALERFYGAVVGEDVEAFAISEDYALGLHRFLARIAALDTKPAWVKGQVTGPFSFAMTVTDEGKRSIAYTPEFNEVATQGMAMKARWMARRLREVGRDALVVLDEPYLCAFGSAFVNVSREDVIAALDTGFAAIHAEGALAGLHCCGNTDWSLVLSTAVDVVNFDAYQYFQGLPLYPQELGAFLARGGILSWGIVPSSGPKEALDARALLQAFDDRVDQLVARGFDRGVLHRQALITPTCGMGTQTVEEAGRVVDTLIELAALVGARPEAR